MAFLELDKIKLERMIIKNHTKLCDFLKAGDFSKFKLAKIKVINSI